MVSERAFYKGNSKSLTLFRLVLRLRKLQLKSNFKLHVLHVAGTRMIEQGTDGLSRGLPFEGLVGNKKDFLTYLPLDMSAFERSIKLKPWIKGWLPKDPVFLSPEDWFEKGHDIIGWKKSPENK